MSLVSALDARKGFRVEVLAIGDELLDGRVADTNTLRLAIALQDVGLKISQRTTVTDDIDAIIREAKAITARGTKLCVVSGGLGPTRDDVTSEAFAQLLDVGLIRDDEQVKRIEERLAKRGRPMTDNQRKQADRPSGAEVIFNPNGTAPGFALAYAGCVFVSTPGVPAEFDGMIAGAVVGPLKENAVPTEKRALYSFGLTEGEVDARLAPLAEKYPDVRVGFRAHMPEIHVSLSARAEHKEALEGALQFTRNQLQQSVFTESTEPFASVVLKKLREAKATLVVAESCTGGLVGDMLTDISGSSDVFVGSFVAYSNQLKESPLNVPKELMVVQGAVSESVVLAMADGARKLTGATYAIAISGIAGPGGGDANKPVGTTCVAIVSESVREARTFRWPFDRRRNKVVSAYTALDWLRRIL